MTWAPIERLTGGAVHEVWRVETQTGPAVLKRSPEPIPGLFAAEAQGLERLRAAGGLRTPDVLEVADDHLLIEWLPPAPIADPDRYHRRFADGLALQHRAASDAFGLDHDNWLGPYPQPNAPLTDWAVFYRERRLLPQIALADASGRLPEGRRRLLDTVIDRLEGLLSGLDERPALLHGDLWRGNTLCVAGEPALIDPAIYFGPREMEIAYIELFESFPPAFIAAYDDAFPLDPGYPRRRRLHQLFPLLVHLNYFGEDYGPAVETACRELVSGQ